VVLIMALPGFRWGRAAYQVEHGKNVGPEGAFELPAFDVLDAGLRMLLRGVVPDVAEEYFCRSWYSPEQCVFERNDKRSNRYAGTNHSAGAGRPSLQWC